MHQRTFGKTAAIAIPLSMKNTFTPDERISLTHITHYLGDFDRYLVIPESLDVQLPGFKTMRFDDRFFGSVLAHNRLMLSRQFYEAFSDYEYVLQHHLDAVVFSNSLLDWCHLGLDYIGAPWIRSEDSPGVTHPRVGNGGLSLRKVESFLKVLRSDRYWIDPETHWAEFCRHHPWYRCFLNLPRRYLKRLHRFNNVLREVDQWPLRPERDNEDYFWSDEATRYYPDFRIASVEVGLRFAFEVSPRKCLELTHGQMPFGCHAWPRYDRAFWEPYLLK